MLPYESRDALINDADRHELLRDLMLCINADALTIDDDALDTLDADAYDTDDIAYAPTMIAHLRNLLDPHHRDMLTDIALSLSLCPLHLIDYAICFDDANDACASIRTIHPSHDT